MAFGDLVQSNGGTIAGTSSFSATLGSAITAGNLVVVMVSANNVPSGANSGWTKSTGCSPVNNAQGLLWWFIGAGGDTIPTVTFASATTSAWEVAEYEGPFDASPYMTSSGAATNGAFATVTSPALTPTAGSDVLFIAGLGGQSGSGDNWNVSSVTLGSFSLGYTNAAQQFRQAATEAHVACLVSRVFGSVMGSYSTTGTFSTATVVGGACRLEMGIAFKADSSVTITAAERQYIIAGPVGVTYVAETDTRSYATPGGYINEAFTAPSGGGGDIDVTVSTLTGLTASTTATLVEAKANTTITTTTALTASAGDETVAAGSNATISGMAGLTASAGDETVTGVANISLTPTTALTAAMGDETVAANASVTVSMSGMTASCGNVTFETDQLIMVQGFQMIASCGSVVVSTPGTGVPDVARREGLMLSMVNFMGT